MKTCICTVIKNEHQYLDEWIQYHLRLGIDYIFIFEDIDSESHKDITDKYDRVYLCGIFDILNESQRTNTRTLKTQHKINVQDLYFTTALKHIQNMNKFDWCFIIDIDEFIICDTIEVLNNYSDYDAVMMSWECYGACEHEKPIKDDEIRLGIWNYNIYKRDFQKALEKPNIKFMCNSVEGWSKDLENDLRSLIS